MDIYFGLFIAALVLTAIFLIVTLVSYLRRSDIHSKPFPWLDPTMPNPSKPSVVLMLLLLLMGLIVIGIFLWSYVIPLMEIHRGQ